MKHLFGLIVLFVLAGLTGGLFAAENMPPPNAGYGRIFGKVIDMEGIPVKSGRVFFYNEALGPPPSPQMYWRVPNIVGQIDKEGNFVRDIPSGAYYIQVLKRPSSLKMFGVPVDGDLVAVPVDLQGNPKKYVIQNGEHTDAGVIANVKAFAKERNKISATGIEGTIVGEDGKPVSGAVVFVYLDTEMNRQPVFGSEKTGKDGKFSVRVDKGGTYYLKVRDEYRAGSPAIKGGLLGVYGDVNPLPVTVKTGEIATKKNIKTKKFPSLAPQKKKAI